MRKILILAVLCMALVAMPAYASVQNIKISGDIDTTWLVRDQFDLGENGESFYQNLMITQTRLRVDADLTDNVGATIALINERAWNENNSGTTNDNENNDIDINLAFVTLREMLYSPLTIIIGRQNFAYGASFVIDSAGTNNNVAAGGLNGVAEDLTKSTALDAIRMVFDYNPLTIDVVAAKVDSNTLTGTGAQDDDVDLFGINANYQLGDDLDTTVESYFWAKIDQGAKISEAVVLGYKADTVYMPGIRVSTNPIKGLSVQAEVAAQFGTKADTNTLDTTDVQPDNVKRRALAAQIITNYMLPFEKTARWSPVVTGAYTYVSGDSGPAEVANKNLDRTDEYYTGWDPMFENQGGGNIYNTLFNLTNSHIVTIKAEAQPMEDVTASVEWNGIWLDNRLQDTATGAATPIEPDGDAGTCTGSDCLTLLQPDGSTLTGLLMTNDLKVGDEVGVGVVYDYTEDVQFGANLNWFFPGNAFHDDNNSVAFQSMVHGNVNF